MIQLLGVADSINNLVCLGRFSFCHLHKNMVEGCSPARRPFEEVVELSLEFSVLDVPPVGPVVDGLAQ